MKYLSLLICAFLIASASVFGQKKTHDHEKFVKKVTMSLAPSLITKWMPDDEAIEYVAGRIDKSKEELEAELKILSEEVKKDAQFIIDNGIYANKYNDISVNVKEESPVKIADIVLHCEFKGDVFDVTLENCIQTDQSWYLGGRIIPSGEGIKGAIAKQEERTTKSKGGLLGKIDKLEEKVEAEAEAEQSSDRMIYVAKRFPMKGTDASSQFIQHDKIGQTLDGYYIDQDYKKVETKIKYEAPEIMSDPNKFIVINGYDIVKSNFKAFYVAGQMYVFTGEYWDILVKEGAIRNLARVVKNDDTGNYVLGELVQKLDQGPENTVSFMMGFKNKMAELVSDNEVMASKVKNKEDGYKFKDIDKIIAEYNAWFDKQYPGKVEYLLERVNGVNNGGAELKNATADQLGKELFNALMSENVEKFKPYIYTKADVEKSSMKDEFKEKLYEQFKDPKRSDENWYGEKEKINQLVQNYQETNPKNVQLVNVEIKKEERESEEVGIEIVKMYIHFTVNGEKRNFKMESAKFTDGWKVVSTSPFLHDPSEVMEEATEEVPVQEETEMEAGEAEIDE